MLFAAVTQKNVNLSKVAITGLLGMIGLMLSPSTAAAQSPNHAYINTMRSSHNTHYFVSIGVTGMAGKTEHNAKVEGQDSIVENKWQGHGIRNEIGVEFLKFLHFSVAHNALNLSGKSESKYHLTGSRFEGTLSLNFYAPLGNLQLGGGALASRVDLRSGNDASGYLGNGFFYNVGYNYFLSTMTSFYLDVRQSQEVLSRNSGSELPKSMKSNLTEAGAGFKIWF